MSGNSDELLRAIGQLEGKVDSVISNQHRHDTSLNSISDRLNKVETKAAVNGAFSGGIVSIGIGFIIAGVKGAFKAHGG